MTGSGMPAVVDTEDRTELFAPALNEAERQMEVLLQDDPGEDGDADTEQTSDASPAAPPAPSGDSPVPPSGAPAQTAAASTTGPGHTATGDDPLAALVKDAKPLTYKVNQQERTFDHVLWLGEGKYGLVPPDRVQEVRNLVARAESNAEANRQLYEEKQRWERAGGLERLYKVQDEIEELNAATLVLLDAIQKNPARLLMQDEDGRLVPDQEYIDFLLGQAGVAGERARYRARDGRQQAEQQLVSTQSEEQIQWTALDQVIDDAGTRYALPADDAAEAKRFFREFANSVFFRVTPEQVTQYGQPVGTKMLDVAKVDAWFKSRKVVRDQAVADAAARRSAERHNASLAGAPPAGQPRRPDGTFAPSASGGKRRPITRGEMNALLRRGADLPDDGMVDDE